MITSAENGGWPGDVTVNDLDLAGLPVPSVIRSAKIATMEVSDAVKLGKITSLLRKQVMGNIGREFGLYIFSSRHCVKRISRSPPHNWTLPPSPQTAP
jgi:hypothetical protein